MNLEELLKEHPKTAIVVKQWLLDRLLEGLKDDKIPEDFKEYARKEGISDDKVIGILQGSPRSMFDVFDDHKIYTSIIVNNQGFTWHINDGESSDVYATRKEADTAAIIESFKLLEAKL